MPAARCANSEAIAGDAGHGMPCPYRGQSNDHGADREMGVPEAGAFQDNQGLRGWRGVC
jgi:hypothetical protein